jgi:hypothetical protein
MIRSTHESEAGGVIPGELARSLVEAEAGMIKSWHVKAVMVCVGVIALAVGVIFLVQHVSEEPEVHQLSQNSPAGLRRGKVVLEFSSAMVTLAAGPPGGPLRVESSFDPDVYTLAQQYEEDDNQDWTYRLDFHENSVLHISVIGIWLGKRSPEVTVLIPPDLPFELEARMEGGYLVMDFADLALSTADVELDRGVLQIVVSDPMDVPMERLSVSSRMGTMRLDRLGNASPERLDVLHRLGAARVNLDGQWRADADIDFRVAVGTGVLRLPDDVRIEGLGRARGRLSRRAGPPPTLRIETRSSLGNTRVTE